MENFQHITPPIKSPDYLKPWNKPRKPEDIEKHNCLLFPLKGFRNQWIFKDEQGEIKEISVNGNMIISNAIALKECTISGMGIALLPNWLVDQDIDNGKLVKLFPHYQVTATDFHTSAWLLYPSRTYQPLKVKCFVKELTNFYS